MPLFTLSELVDQVKSSNGNVQQLTLGIPAEHKTAQYAKTTKSGCGNTAFAEERSNPMSTKTLRRPAPSAIVVVHPGATAMSPNRDRPSDLSTYRGRLGAAVRKRRKALGLSQGALAERLAQHGTDVSVPALSTYEGGKRPIQIDDLPAFAAALETTVKKLLPDA